jgi:hypothetical protein
MFKLKAMKKLFVFLGVTLLFCANLMFSSKKENGSLSVRNIEMLQISAGEAGCRWDTNKWCQVEVASSILLGVGTPYIIY